MSNSVLCFSQIFQTKGLTHLAYDIISFFDIDTLKEIVKNIPKAISLSDNFTSQIESDSTKKNSEIAQSWTHLKEQKENREESDFAERNARERSGNDLLVLIKRVIFIKEYLNKADRSMYFSFYEEPYFHDIQQSQIRQIIIRKYPQNSSSSPLLCQNSKFLKEPPELLPIEKPIEKTLCADLKDLQSEQSQTALENLPECIENIFQLLQQELDFEEVEFQELRRIFEDPALPLPKMKRQNEGLYCNSPFQLFLVALRFPHNSQDQMESSELFPELYQKMLVEEDLYLKRFLEIQKDRVSRPESYQSVHMVRYTPYQINYQNFRTFLLPEHHLHNCIVYVFALTELYLDGVRAYLESISDPTYAFVELIARYNNFRSFVMEFEEGLGFLFSNYQVLFSDAIRESTITVKPDYCFWRPAMTKWYNAMSRFHPASSCVFFEIITKLRVAQLFPTFKDQSTQSAEHSQEEGELSPLSVDSLFAQTPLLKSKQISIRNALRQQFSEFEGFDVSKFQKNKNVSHKDSTSSVVNELLEENSQNCEALVAEYLEYLIDLSVNEQTVHWCGHSRNDLEKPYRVFNEEFKSYNSAFCSYLESCVERVDFGQSYQSKTEGIDLQKFALNRLLQNSLEFLDQKKLIKPVTLCEIVADLNERHEFTANEQKEAQVEGDHLPEEGSSTYCMIKPIRLDFRESDETLKYFNEKAKIVQQIQEDSKCFFSISPLLSPEEILIKSIDTTEDGNGSDIGSQDNSFEYLSEDDEDQIRNSTKFCQQLQKSENSPKGDETEKQSLKKELQEEKNSKSIPMSETD